MILVFNQVVAELTAESFFDILKLPRKILLNLNQKRKRVELWQI